MTYWLAVFSPTSWKEFMNAEGKILGFNDFYWKRVSMMKYGDIIICYMIKEISFFSALEIISEPFTDFQTQIWSGGAYPWRVHVKSIVTLNPQNAIKVKDIFSKLDLFKRVGLGPGWGNLLQSPKMLSKEDGSLILSQLKHLQGSD